MNQILAKKTNLAYVATRVLDTPFWGVFNLLTFILYKDLHITPFQLAFMIALKPLVSIFSSYWSTLINQRKDKLKENIVWARIIGYLPFFFFPFVNNSWFFIASFGIYMTLAVGIVPAWMELLRLNVPKIKREKVFSYSQAFGYLGGGLLPFILGGVLDEYSQAWRWMFPAAALVGLSALFFQMRIQVAGEDEPFEKKSHPITHHLLKPWKNVWNLLRERPDFQRFQIGFMILGGGLMVIQPALPIYFMDVLNLSYTELAISMTLCKGLGFALGSPYWSKTLNEKDIFGYSALVALIAALFPILLLFSGMQVMWLYVAYFIYGFMQSGNELVWNMSGPIFSHHKDSSTYSTTNLIAVGIRGCFIPMIGGLLIAYYQPSLVMFLGLGLCLIASLNLFYCSKRVLVLE